MIKRKVVCLQQHTHPASHKNSALRVGLFFIDLAKIAYYGGWWFQDTALFSNPARLAKTISNMDEELGRSDFPPSWIMLEITTFGTVSILYGNLNSGRCKRQIAKYFGVADTVMVSFPLCKEPIGRNRALPSGWTVRTQNIECGF